MNGPEFSALTTDCLTDQWGSYPPAAIQKLWLMCQHLSVGDVRWALDQLAMTCFKAPTLGQIRGALLPMIQRANVERRKARLAQLRMCPDCRNGGWVYAMRHDNHEEYAFLCNCSAPGVLGLTQSRGAQRWSIDFENEYCVRRFTPEEFRDLNDIQRAKIKPKNLLSEAEAAARVKADLASFREGRA